MSKTILFTILLSLLPISELRGAIPFAYFNGIPLISAYIISTVSNAMIGPLAAVFFKYVHKLLYKIELYRKFFDASVGKARRKVENKIAEYGYWGLMLFVAVPLPVTGAWTGCLAAWVLGLDKKKSCMSVALGVMISGLIVSLILLTGKGLSSIFIKDLSF